MTSSYSKTNTAITAHHSRALSTLPWRSLAEASFANTEPAATTVSLIVLERSLVQHSTAFEVHGNNYSIDNKLSMHVQVLVSRSALSLRNQYHAPRPLGTTTVCATGSCSGIRTAPIESQVSIVTGADPKRTMRLPQLHDSASKPRLRVRVCLKTPCSLCSHDSAC